MFVTLCPRIHNMDFYCFEQYFIFQQLLIGKFQHTFRIMINFFVVIK